MNNFRLVRFILNIGLLVSGLMLFGGLPASASGSLTCDPASLQTLATKQGRLLGKAVQIFAASESSLGGLPYCQITAIIVTEAKLNDKIFVAIDLPDPLFWNSRFLFTGDGGFGGRATPDTVHLQLGYAVAATDTGHESSSATDATWALNNAPAIKDFQYLAVHESTRLAEAITTAYYDITSDSYFTYFDGCSTGGRQALVEAQKYPKDYQGIVAGAPAAGQFYLAYNWNSQATLVSSDAYLNIDQIDLLSAAVLSECDGLDGAVDGLIQDPRACNFNPLTLLCASGQTTGCLTQGQINTVNAIWQGAMDTKGKQLYPGFAESDPASSSGLDVAWDQYLAGCPHFNDCALPDFTAAEPWPPPTFVPPPIWWDRQDSFMKYFVYSDASYNSRAFSFSDQASIKKDSKKTSKWGADAMKANLKPFVNKGHKLLIYHGWSDPSFSPFVSVNYYDSVQSILGLSTPDSVRLFMVPGMHHCQGKGPGPNTFDEITPVLTWVEQGVAPDGIIASHYTNDDPSQPVDRTMPLCAYPEQAVYDGVGPVNDASSWSCQSVAAPKD
jgi:feruloyl esterase